MSSASDAAIPARHSVGLEVVALCVGNALAYLGPGEQPIWVAVLIKNGLLTTSQIGLLATAELLLLAISTLVVSAWGRRVSPRVIGVVAALLVAVANAIAMVPTVQTIVIGRLLSGLATGALLTSITGVAARRPDAQRVLALMLATFLLLMSSIYFFSPILVSRYGPAGLFALVAGVGLVASVTSLFGLPELTAKGNQTKANQFTRTIGAQKLASLLGCLGLATMAGGTNMVVTYMITIGNELGFDVRTMAHVLGVAMPFGILGAVAAHILGERAGLLRPIVLALLIATADVLVLISATSPVLLGIYAALLPTSMAFCIPYGIALVGRVEPSGRLASAAQAFIMIGSAAGPKLGSELIGFAHFRAFSAVAALCLALSILLFIAASGLAAIRARFAG